MERSFFYVLLFIFILLVLYSLFFIILFIDRSFDTYTGVLGDFYQEEEASGINPALPVINRARCEEYIDRSCAVMSWISVHCVDSAIRAAHGGKPEVGSLFQLDLFAHKVAEQLRAADMKIQRLEMENEDLRLNVL